MQWPTKEQDTESSWLFGTPTFGLAMTRHSTPFQTSMKVCPEASWALPDEPTATQFFREAHAMDLRNVAGPDPLGLGVIRQAGPPAECQTVRKVATEVRNGRRA